MISSWTTLIGYDEDPLVATLATVNGKKRYRHTVGNVLDVLEALRGHRYVLALGSHMHAPERSSFVTDGVQALDANPKAKAFFATLNSANRYAILWRIQTVKRAETRAKKIEHFVGMFERHEVIHS